MNLIKCAPQVRANYFEGSDCDKFAQKVLAAPMTNGDRIRSMTDEELAEFILDKRENGTCFNNKCYYYDPNKGCDDCTLEWLKQPVR